jgi:hypothetical protein
MRGALPWGANMWQRMLRLRVQSCSCPAFRQTFEMVGHAKGPAVACRAHHASRMAVLVGARCLEIATQRREQLLLGPGQGQ